MTCGAGALCKEKLNSVECYCPSGLKGNPYVQCVGKYLINFKLVYKYNINEKYCLIRY